ncbi:DUF6634 family protein [Ensifer adhaerens]|uniref:DUF6634 family protein n=1 Tax=Ensifer adhaerens TaxID=106592 RepID=UPI003F836B66
MLLLEAGTVDEAVLAAAPILQFYKLVVGPACALGGVVRGHPHLPDGHEIVSSQLFYLDAERGVARTLNRWYRLGLPDGCAMN